MERLSKTRAVLLMVALSLTGMMVSDMVIVPVADSIFKDFSGDSPAILNYVLSGPALLSALSTLAVGALATKYDKKKLFIACYVVFMIGAVAGDLVNSSLYMAAMRTLVGIGMGGVLVLLTSIISDAFTDEAERGTMMGIFTGAATALGALMGIMAGAAATGGWHNAFRIYLLCIPVLVLDVLFIPSRRKESATSSVDMDSPVASLEEASPEAEGSWGRLVPLVFGAFVANLVFSVIYYLVSLIVVEKGITDMTVVGIAASMASIGSFATSMTFGVTYSKFKDNSATLSFVGMCCGFMLLFLVQGTVPIMLSLVFLGAAYGISLCYYTTKCTFVVSPNKVPVALSVVSFAMSLGGFGATYLISFLGLVMGTSSTVAPLPVLAVACAAMAVFSFAYALAEGRLTRQVGDVALEA